MYGSHSTRPLFMFSFKDGSTCHASTAITPFQRISSLEKPTYARVFLRREQHLRILAGSLLFARSCCIFHEKHLHLSKQEKEITVLRRWQVT